LWLLPLIKPPHAPCRWIIPLADGLLFGLILDYVANPLAAGVSAAR
jgi:hypothetical protein